MRLIDADELFINLDGMMEVSPTGYIHGETVADMISDAPTIDAVPVRHGKWIHEVRYTIDSLHSYQQYRCSECGMTYITNTKYCPNCGARMDEEDK